MPCFSTIRTKLTDGTRLDEALRNLGYTTEVGSGFIVAYRGEARSLVFTSEGGTFNARGDTSNLATISRLYAEYGVRDWAKRRGYSVQEADSRSMTIVNRRS